MTNMDGSIHLSMKANQIENHHRFSMKTTKESGKNSLTSIIG